MCSYMFNRERPVGHLSGLRQEVVCLFTSVLLWILESCATGARNELVQGRED